MAGNSMTANNTHSTGPRSTAHKGSSATAERMQYPSAVHTGTLQPSTPAVAPTVTHNPPACMHTLALSTKIDPAENVSEHF